MKTISDENSTSHRITSRVIRLIQKDIIKQKFTENEYDLAYQSILIEVINSIKQDKNDTH